MTRRTSSELVPFPVAPSWAVPDLPPCPTVASGASVAKAAARAASTKATLGPRLGLAIGEELQCPRRPARVLAHVEPAIQRVPQPGAAPARASSHNGEPPQAPANRTQHFRTATVATDRQPMARAQASDSLELPPSSPASSSDAAGSAPSKSSSSSELSAAAGAATTSALMSDRAFAAAARAPPLPPARGASRDPWPARSPSSSSPEPSLSSPSSELLSSELLPSELLPPLSVLGAPSSRSVPTNSSSLVPADRDRADGDVPSNMRALSIA